jgi:hypothetical protein
MDNNILKKRLNIFKGSNGKLKNISDEVVIEVLRAWEQWSGTTASLYRELELSKMQMVIIIKKAKSLVKLGYTDDYDFNEVEVDRPSQNYLPSANCSIELVWQNNVIRVSLQHICYEISSYSDIRPHLNWINHIKSTL